MVLCFTIYKVYLQNINGLIIDIYKFNSNKVLATLKHLIDWLNADKLILSKD